MIDPVTPETSNQELRRIVGELVTAVNVMLDVDRPFVDQVVPANAADMSRFTVQKAVPAPWSNASRPEDDEPEPGTVWEKWGPDNKFVMVKQEHGWQQFGREELDGVRPEPQPTAETD